MSKDSLEHLSCLMDGEIQHDTSKFLVRRLGTDKDMRSTWDRYHLIRDCLRHADGGIAHTSLSQRVSVALEAEKLDATAIAAIGRSAPRWARPFAGAAIAATVALMAVYAVAPVSENAGLAPAELVTAESAQPFASPNVIVNSPFSQPVNLSGTDRSANRRMNSYLLRHYQVAGSSAGKGFVSFVPIVVARRILADGVADGVAEGVADGAAEPEDQEDAQIADAQHMADTSDTALPKQ